jgi:hypothetical protein
VSRASTLGWTTVFGFEWICGNDEGTAKRSVASDKSCIKQPSG